MIYNNMDLSRMIVHVQQVEDSRKKSRVLEVRRPNHSNKIGSSRGGGRSTFGVRDQPRFKKGHQSLGNSNSQRSASPREGRPEPKNVNRGDVQRPIKECGKYGRIHSAESRLGKMPASIAERVNTWSGTVHKIRVRLEVMLILGLIPRMPLQPSLLRGTKSIP